VITEERLQAVERRAEELERRMLRVEAAALDGQRPAGRASEPERRSVAEPVALGGQRPAAAEPERPRVAEPVWRKRPSVAEPERASTTERVRPDRPARELDLEQLLGGRVLAWVGGVAVLAGLALLFALAVSRGWIGEGARTAIGFTLSAGLVALGVWLHRRGGRTEAARAAVGAGIAGLFMTVTVAANVYELVPAAGGLALAFAVGVLAAAVSIRWASRTIGALGIVGALLAPVLVGAPSNGATVAFVAVASLCALAVVMHQRWDWLALAVVVIGAPQWLWWLFDHAHLTGALAVLVGFGAMYLGGAMAAELRLPARRLRTSAAFLFAINALVLGIAGFQALDELSGRPAAIAWLASLAIAHALAARVAGRHRAVSHEVGLLCLALAVLLADAGFALAAHGPVEALGWTAGAVCFAAIVRRRTGPDGVLAQLGLGGHVAFAAVQTCAQLDLGQLAAPGAEAGAVGALAALAAGCLVSARLAADGRPQWRVALDACGLLALAGLAALTLDGPALAATWAAEAVALGRLARRTRDDVTLVAALAHLAAAAVYASATFAQPVDLVEGGASIGNAALGLGAVAAAALAGAWMAPAASRLRTHLAGAGAGAVLYLASLAVVAWAPGAGEDALLQQGQLQLSALWSVAGVVALMVGLRRDLREVRLAALGLLAATVAKVFLYDLSELTSVYRVASFIGLGLLLLLAAFAYQRLRPEPLQDLRAMPGSLR
jgi:uncharacterized membrane protein